MFETLLSGPSLQSLLVLLVVPSIAVGFLVLQLLDQKRCLKSDVAQEPNVQIFRSITFYKNSPRDYRGHIGFLLIGSKSLFLSSNERNFVLECPSTNGEVGEWTIKNLLFNIQRLTHIETNTTFYGILATHN